MNKSSIPSFMGKTANEILNEIDLAVGVSLRMGNESMDYADLKHHPESAYHLFMFKFLQDYWATIPEKHKTKAASYTIGAYDEWDNLMRVVEIRNRTLEKSNRGK